VLKEIRTVNSQAIGHEMTYRVYGEAGKPVVAFPTSQSHENLWEDFGMVECLADYIDNGVIQLYALDSIDDDTFFRADNNRKKALRCYERYLRYVATEMLPEITATAGQKPLLTGCSMGAYHAANIYFRWPELADSVIALSGVYSPHCFLDFDSHMTKPARANSPLDYLTEPIDGWRREQYCSSKLVFCAGQGPGEEDMLADTKALSEVLNSQGIEAWVDLWGEDVTHDWPWWKEQIRYFLPAVIG